MRSGRLEAVPSSRRQLDAGPISEGGCGRPAVREIPCKTALSPSRLPGLDLALNPYRGCQHACVYCYAPYVLREERPWGTFVDVKRNMPLVLDRELRKRGAPSVLDGEPGKKAPGVVGLGTVTDCYQPLEEGFRVTRNVLEVLLRRGLTASVQTKSALVLRDADLLERFPKIDVGFTITTLDETAARVLEPRAASPSERLGAMAELAKRGISVWAFVGPVIPGVTDADLEGLLENIARSGAKKVLSDRLRLRGAIGRRVAGALESLGKDMRAFESSVGDPGYYEDLDRRIEKLCRAHGIAWERAFPSSGGGP